MEFDNRFPIYEQVMSQFKQALISGHYKANDLLPSRRELANQFKINPNTVQKAYKELENQGYVVTDGNIQSHVTNNQVKIDSLKEEYLTKTIADFYQSLIPLSLSEEEVQFEIHKYWGLQND